MKNFIEFTLYNGKQRILIDINDIRCITEQNDYTCKFYFFSDIKTVEIINSTYDQVIQSLKKSGK